MNLRSVYRVVMLCLLLSAATDALHAADFALDRGTLAHLTTLAPSQSVLVKGFPVGPSRAAALHFERVQIYADDARIFELTADGRRELPRSTHVFLRGYADDGSARAAIALNADGTFADGSVSGPDGTFVLRAGAGPDGRSLLSARMLRDLLPPDFRISFDCGNASSPMALDAGSDIAAKLGIAPGAMAAPTATTASALRFATVAVDTDNPFMLKLFNNNTTSATNWIASMFNTMNLMYERDLLVRLYVGTTYFQTIATDPYTSMTASGTTNTSMSDNLNIFSSYWKNNHPAGNPTRAFAILLSGLLSSTANSCSSSGIAWVNAYCKTGTVQPDNSTFGSYSVNQVCTSTNPFFGPDFSALLVAHELGHNFGANHTHCTDATTGASKVSSNTIDTCFNGESNLGCYGGSTTSCPASGPGAPAGTIMSYCNQKGCGPDHQNVLYFHPTHISKVLLPDITAAPVGCLNTTDDVFFNGFQ